MATTEEQRPISSLNPAFSMQVRPESQRPATGIYGTPRPPAPEGSWVEAPRAAPAAVARPAPAAPALPALATRTLEPSATGTVLGQSAVDANSAAARGDYAQAVAQGVRGLAGAIPALAVDTAEVFAPAARGFGNVVSTLFTGKPMQDTAPAVAAPQAAARPAPPAPAQPATQPAASTVAKPAQPPAPQPTPAPQPQRVDGIISPRRGVYGNVTGDTTEDGKPVPRQAPMNDTALRDWQKKYGEAGKALLPMYRFPNATEYNAARELGLEGASTYIQYLRASPAIILLDEGGIIRWHSEGIQPAPAGDTTFAGKDDQYTIVQAIEFAQKNL